MDGFNCKGLCGGKVQNGMSNNNRAWNILVARVEGIDGKLDRVLSKMNGLGRHDEQIKTHSTAIKGLWAIVLMLFTAIVAAFIRGGTP